MTERLSAEEAAAALARAEPIPSPRGVQRGPVRQLEGLDPRGALLEVRLVGPTVVVFASTTCDGCKDLARLVREGVVGFDVVGVLRAPREGLPNAETTAFTGTAGCWVLGDAPFHALGVHAAPFFCILDAQGAVVVEGVAFGGSHVAAHCARVLVGDPRPDTVRLTPEAG